MNRYHAIIGGTTRGNRIHLNSAAAASSYVGSRIIVIQMQHAGDEELTGRYEYANVIANEGAELVLEDHLEHEYYSAVWDTAQGSRTAQVIPVSNTNTAMYSTPFPTIGGGGRKCVC